MKNLLPRLFLALALALALPAFVHADEEPVSNQPPPEFAGYEQVTKEMTPPEVVKATQPRYTRQARRAQVEGVMTLWVGLGRNGRVEKVAVRTPLGYGLDEAAMKAVRKWRFRPARRDGEPVTVVFSVETRFRLEE